MSLYSRFKGHFGSILTVLVLFSVACQPQTQQSLYDQLALEEITIDELQARYESGELTARQVVDAYIERIETLDAAGPKLNSVRTVNPNARAIADSLDRERAEGRVRGPLHGVPILLKDNIDTYDMPTTAGSRLMDGSIPPDDAFITKKLRDAGAIILGKTNLSEWANFHSNGSSSGWSGLGGQVNNPYDLTRNPCGSSSGSGAAASANMATLTIGSETNGSIVCPSTVNGLVGLKPTIGLWSRDGIIPISYTTDSAGPMVRTVRDAAILLGALTGVDANDPKTADSEAHIHEDYTQFLNAEGLEGKRLGFFTGPMGSDFKLDTLMYQTIRLLESKGAEIVQIERLPETNIGAESYQVLLFEFKDGLDKYFASLGENAPVKSMQDLADQTKANPIETAVFDRDLIFQAAAKGGLDSEEYQYALERMLRFSREEGIDKVMNELNLDAIVAPTGSPAWKTDIINGDNFGTSSSSPSARAGYPIITVPMGDIQGLPVGISFFGRAWSEPVLLEVAYAFEQATQKRFPPQLGK